jgi:transposase
LRAPNPSSAVTETTAAEIRRRDKLGGLLHETTEPPPERTRSNGTLQVEKLIAAEALSWPEVKRLMTVPGVNVIVAATFMAAVGDIRRFPDRRKLTAYLGLDPRVRQSGAGPANHGRISKQGSSSAGHALVEACWSTVRQPAPSPASTSAFGRAAATRSPLSPARASSRVCSGVC